MVKPTRTKIEDSELIIRQSCAAPIIKTPIENKLFNAIFKHENRDVLRKRYWSRFSGRALLCYVTTCHYASAVGRLTNGLLPTDSTTCGRAAIEFE